MEYFHVKTIDDLTPDEVKGKRVFVRVDFNVPVKNGFVENDLRIRSSLPTIKTLLEKEGKIILVSHLGRPKGKRSEEFSLVPVYSKLKELLPEYNLYFVETIEELISRSKEIKEKEMILFENIRFYEGEEKNDLELAKKLAESADLYVNDAFGTAHRAHSSTEGVARFVKPAVAGYLIQREIEYLSKAIHNPAKPYVAIIGGAKISDKIEVIRNLLKFVDKLIIGGAMMFTFYRAQGLSTGKSLVEEDKINLARELLEESKGKILLPSDCVISDSFDPRNRTTGSLKTVNIQEIPEWGIGLDIGGKTIEIYRKEILNAKTIVWNGPMGVFEIEETAKGTFELARALAEATRQGATSIIGGGDSASAIEKIHLENEVSHVSTGGGASLEFLEGKVLPGIAILDKK